MVFAASRQAGYFTAALRKQSFSYVIGVLENLSRVWQTQPKFLRGGNGASGIMADDRGSCYPSHMSSFGDQCKKVFLDNTAARLARFSGYGHRAAQKFLGQQAEVPEDLRGSIDLQALILSSHDPTEQIQAAVDEAVAKGVSDEAVASRLSVIYKRLTGIDIS